jgi:hypothetical protein
MVPKTPTNGTSPGTVGHLKRTYSPVQNMGRHGLFEGGARRIQFSWFIAVGRHEHHQHKSIDRRHAVYGRINVPRTAVARCVPRT